MLDPMNASQHPGKDFIVSSDIALLDVPWVVKTILAQYWGVYRNDYQIRRSLAGSLNFGLYEGVSGIPAKQIGFARVITDYATFSYLCDVVIEESYRHQGFGKFLLSQVLSHEVVNRTVGLLRTRDGQRLYAKFGFCDAVAMLRKPGGTA